MVNVGKRKLLLVSGVVVTTYGLAACSSLSDNYIADETVVAQQQDFTASTGDQKGIKTLPEQALDAPVGGGEFVERVPYNALPERFGNSAEDLSVSMPVDDIDSMKVLGEDDCDDYRFVEMSDSKKSDKKATLHEKVEKSQLAETARNPSVVKGLEASDSTNESNDIEDWLAPEGSSLRSLLMDWGDRAGWKVIWKSDREYLLEAGAVFRGRYMDVTAALIRTFARARPAPIATFYKGNKVLLITTLEDENAD